MRRNLTVEAAARSLFAVLCGALALGCGGRSELESPVLGAGFGDEDASAAVPSNDAAPVDARADDSSSPDADLPPGIDACVPATCDAACGPVPDGCGGTLECGECTDARACSTVAIITTPLAGVPKVISFRLQKAVPDTATLANGSLFVPPGVDVGVTLSPFFPSAAPTGAYAILGPTIPNAAATGWDARLPAGSAPTLDVTPSSPAPVAPYLGFVVTGSAGASPTSLTFGIESPTGSLCSLLTLPVRVQY